MKRFQNILYVADSAATTLEAFNYAVELAVKNDAQLTVLQVMERIPSYVHRLTPHLLRENRIKEQQGALDKMCEKAAGRIEVEAKILEGTPFLEIIREILSNGRDLVVKSAESGGGAIERVFGTDDMHLLRKCPCPVWLITSTQPTPIRRIMAAVDVDEFDDSDKKDDLNRQILELAISLAHREHSELYVVHAWYPVGKGVMGSQRTGISKEGMEAYIKDVKAHERRWFRRLLRHSSNWVGKEVYDAVKPQTRLREGFARDVIPNTAKELQADLIVMGTVGRTGIGGLLIGNTAEAILNNIDCSVLAVKPPGFVTPVTLED